MRRPIHSVEAYGAEGTFDLTMQQRLVDKKAVIPLVSAIPVLACVFAFSLGPAPEKRVLNFYQNPSGEVTALEPYRSEVVPLLLADLPNKTQAHRAEVIQFVGAGRHPEAVVLLGKIAADGTEARAIREAAQAAVESLNDKSVRAGL